MVSIPEIKLISKTNQSAVAKIGLAAYDAKSMRLLGDGGTSLSQSTDNNWHVLGIGPYQNGTVHREIERGIPSTAGQPYEELPTVVAFAAPDSAGQANIAEQPPRNPVRPASQTTPKKE
jgi:hypothetical protein